MAEVRWTPQALSDLEATTEFIARDSYHYASLFVLDILAAVQRVERFPKSGRMVPEKNEPKVREIIFGNYRIVYRLRDEIAELLTIHHGARPFDPSQLD